MHRDMMEQIFKIKHDGSEQHAYLRAAAKNGFVFPEFYGDYYINCANYMACKWGQLPNGIFKDDTGVPVDSGGTTLGRHLRNQGIKSIRSFENHLKIIEDDFWENRFPDYAKWKRRQWNLYKRHGYVDLLTGFRCYGVMGKNDAGNYPVQGAAFHCLLWSFIQLDQELQIGNYDTKLIGQIHDSMLLDTNPAELTEISKLVHEITTQRLPKAWSWIIVPLEIDAEICPIDGSWAEKEKYKLV
jgi:hypothetical protein